MGGASVSAGGVPATGAAQQRKTLALLAILAAAGRSGLARDKIEGLLWPESDAQRARGLLKQACYALRRDLHAAELFAGSVELRLNAEVIASDVEAVIAALDRGDRESAVAAYTGPFLDGLYLNENAEFERWTAEFRATLKQRISDALEELARAANALGDSRASVQWWRKLASHEPLSTTAATGLVRALISAGDRAAALDFGRVHETLLRQELGVAPDSAFTELLASARAAKTAAPSLPTTAPSVNTTPQAPIQPTRHWAVRSPKRVVVGGGTLLLAAAAIFGARLPTPIDADLIAVAPFQVLDARQNSWRLGLVDILSRNLDGVGVLRSLPSSVVSSEWTGRADQANAQNFGRRNGAAHVLFGELLDVGHDSVRLKAVLLDVVRNAVVGEFDRSAAGGRVDLLADALSFDVLRFLEHPARDAGFLVFTPRTEGERSSIGTSSFLAAKAFRQGEAYMARYSLDSATTAFDQAIAIDSAFAMAWWGAFFARSWNYQGDVEPYRIQSVAHNRGLSGRDSLLIAVHAHNTPEGDLTFYDATRQKQATLRNALLQYPTDARLWFALGDQRFHASFATGERWSDARTAFDRAIALDSGFALSYVHPVTLALHDNDVAGAMRYVNAFRSIKSVNVEGGGMELIAKLLDARRSARELTTAIDEASPTSVFRAAQAVLWWPDQHETQIALARKALANASEHLTGAPHDTANLLRPYRMILADALVFRGHLREAADVVRNQMGIEALFDLATLGGIPGDTIDTLLEDWYHPRGRMIPALLSSPWFESARCHRVMAAAVWFAGRRDTLNLLRRVNREDSLALIAVAKNWMGSERPNPDAVRAALQLARGDSANALAAFMAMRPICPDPRPLHRIRFQLLAALGKYEEAARVFDATYERRPDLMLERAYIAEQLGDASTAIKYFELVVLAWRKADPQLQRFVAEAQTGSERLRDDTRGQRRSR